MVAFANPEGLPPRWEWRQFFRTRASQPFVQPDWSFSREAITREVYLLLPDTRLNLKIRYHCLDLKILKEITRDGIQLWDLIYKEPFPIQGVALKQFWSYVPLLSKLTEQDFLTEDDLLARAGEQAEIAVVHVSKTRTLYHRDTTGIDLAQIKIGSHHWHTFSAEDADLEALRHLLAELFPRLPGNESYPVFLSTVSGEGLSHAHRD